MGVDKKILRHGNGVDYPQKHDEVSVEYTGWIFEEGKPGNKGNMFDSSVDRGDLITRIGVGRVIKGWDEAITNNMSLGEKATLIITSDYGYGSKGFLGHIPPDAKLIFDVELKAINGKRALGC